MMVSHLSSDNAAITRRRDAPNHYFLSRIICFDRHCRGTVGYISHNKKRRFKGFKNRSIPPRTVPTTPKDSLVVSNLDNQIVYEHVAYGRPIEFKNANFEVNSARLLSLFLKELDQFSIFLKEHPELDAKIIGHTDDVGTAEANQKLSQLRAQAVVDYLISKGIKTPRLVAIGMGLTQPIKSGPSIEARAANRRVEFEIIEN